MSEILAGAASVDITPSLGCHLCGYFNDRIATDIHDPLLVKAVVMRRGETTLGVIVCDLIALPDDVVHAAKARIQGASNVPPENVLISCSHTHTGPSVVGALGTPAETGYAASLPPRIADAFLLALGRLQPAEAAHISGDCAEEVHNRRWHMNDGSVVMNPGYQNPNAIRCAGPTDPELGLLILRTPHRKPIAVLANLALHYVGSRAGTTVSADYFEVFARQLQRFAGAEFVAIMANGCQGNINNCDFTKPPRQHVHAYHQIERVANVVAAEAWKCWNLLREDDFRADIELGAAVRMVPFEARMPAPEELDRAREIYASAESSADKEWIYARELVLLADEPRCRDVPVHALRVGDLGIVGLHGEVFCEIGLAIKRRSAFTRTMVIGLANGSAGYIPTDQALDEGSYETRLCRHVRAPKGTAELWTDTAVDLLTALR